MGGFVKKTADVDFFFQPLLKLTFERFRRVQIGQPLVDSVHGFAAQLYMFLDILLGTVAKLAMRQPFVLFKGLTFQKLCLP
ncbi:hypothetical protein, partial [Aeromonas enteropelogenes]|uniref:hypothetical protein n=1 Tax=Aeromonas enteropelogenes TaxID=29489 RepID=UPI003BA2E78A